MSQQINLFDASLLPSRTWLSTPVLAVILLAGIAAAAGYGSLVSRQMRQAEASAKASGEEVKALRDRLVKQAAAGRPEPSRALAEEVKRLEAAVDVREQIIARLEGSGVGSAGGFSRYLEALARHPSRGVWLTGLSVGGGGADLYIQGRALNAELLPGFIQSLTQEDALRGKEVSELRLAQRAADAVAAAPSQGTAQGTAAVAAGAHFPSRTAAQAPRRMRFIEFSLGSRPAANRDG